MAKKQLKKLNQPKKYLQGGSNMGSVSMMRQSPYYLGQVGQEAAQEDLSISQNQILSKRQQALVNKQALKDAQDQQLDSAIQNSSTQLIQAAAADQKAGNLGKFMLPPIGVIPSATTVNTGLVNPTTGKALTMTLGKTTGGTQGVNFSNLMAQEGAKVAGDAGTAGTAASGGMSALTSGLIGVAGNIAGTVIKNKTNDNSAYTATNKEATGNVVGSGVKSAATGFVLGNMILPGVGGAIGAGLGAGIGALKARKQNKASQEEADRLQREQTAMRGAYQSAFVNSRLTGADPGNPYTGNDVQNQFTNQYQVAKFGGVRRYATGGTTDCPPGTVFNPTTGNCDPVGNSNSTAIAPPKIDWSNPGATLSLNGVAAPMAAPSNASTKQYSAGNKVLNVTTQDPTLQAGYEAPVGNAMTNTDQTSLAEAGKFLGNAIRGNRKYDLNTVYEQFRADNAGQTLTTQQINDFIQSNGLKFQDYQKLDTKWRTAAQKDAIQNPNSGGSPGAKGTMGGNDCYGGTCHPGGDIRVNPTWTKRLGGITGIQEDRRPKRVPGGMIVPIEGTDAVEFKGRSHKQGGIIIDKDANGNPTVEVEKDEVMLPLKMKDGKKQDYIFSDYLKIGNESFAQKSKNILKGGGTKADLQQLAVMQEKMAGRNSQQVAVAKYGGIPQYAAGGFTDPPSDAWKKIAAEYIAKKEGFLDKGRWDENAYRAGYGSDRILRDGKLIPVTKGMVVTKEEALATLEAYSIDKYSNQIAKDLGQENWDKLNDNQRAALTSLGYNAGAAFISKRNYGRKIKYYIEAGNLDAAGDVIYSHGPKSGARSGYLPALEKRRKEESNLFNSTSNQTSAQPVKKTKKALLPPPPVSADVVPPTFAQRNSLPGTASMRMNEEIQMSDQTNSNIVLDPTMTRQERLEKEKPAAYTINEQVPIEPTNKNPNERKKEREERRNSKEYNDEFMSQLYAAGYKEKIKNSVKSIKDMPDVDKSVKKDIIKQLKSGNAIELLKGTVAFEELMGKPIPTVDELKATYENTTGVKPNLATITPTDGQAAVKKEPAKPVNPTLYYNNDTQKYIYRDENGNELMSGYDQNRLTNQMNAQLSGATVADQQLADAQKREDAGGKPTVDNQTVIAQQNGMANAPATNNGKPQPTNAQNWESKKQLIIDQVNSTPDMLLEPDKKGQIINMLNSPDPKMRDQGMYIFDLYAQAQVGQTVDPKATPAPGYSPTVGVKPPVTANGGPGGTAPTINNQNSTFQYTAQTPGYLDYNDPNTAGGIFSGDRYEKEWKPLVGSTMADAAKADQVINYLTNYTGTDADDVKAKLKGKNRAEQIAAINDLATDTKVGPFHNAVFGAINNVNNTGGNVATITPPSTTVIPPVIPPSTISGNTATTKRYTPCPPGTYLSTDGTCKQTPEYSKPYDGNIVAAIGAGAQLIPPIYAALNPYQKVGAIPGAPSVRGALLGRENYNPERGNVRDMYTAVNQEVTNNNTGASGFAIRQAANVTAGKQMLDVANAEAKVNTELRGKEAVLGQDASKFNAENSMKGQMFNADLAQKQNQYVDERNVGVVDAAANRLAGMANTYNQYKATDHLARVTNANTHSLERDKMYESLLKDAQNKNSQFNGASDAELRRIAAGLVEEQMGGVGRTGGVRQYISRLGELKSARATKAKL